jgi:hypothetical protein
VQGELADLFRGAGLQPDLDDELTVEVGYDSFDAWWESCTLGVGPAGDHLARSGPSVWETLRRRCAALLPRGTFTVEATAWFVAAPR